jgi:hypothetical protein
MVWAIGIGADSDRRYDARRLVALLVTDLRRPPGSSTGGNS